MNKKGVVPYTFLGILLLVGVLIYGGLNGWFNINISNYITNQQQKQLEMIPSGECSASVSPQAGWVGDTFVGTAVDGKNTLCTIYYKYVGDALWQIYGSGFTDAQGILKVSEVLKTAGQVDVRAVCGDCTTNTVRIYVNTLPDGGGGSGGDGGGFGGGEPIVACSSRWPPAKDSSVCSSRDSTCPVGERCYFHPSTMATQAYCKCAKPASYPDGQLPMSGQGQYFPSGFGRI